MSGLTPSQTVGPFFHDCLLQRSPRRLYGEETAGTRIVVTGRVVDGERAPVADALVELWQANAHGRYRHPGDQRDAPLDPDFIGFGRCGTDRRGCYRFETVKPGRVSGPDGTTQAPHLCLLVFARGLLNHLVTRVYFPEDDLAADPVLQTVPEGQRASLIAEADGEGATYRFDIVLQGEGQTAFFAQ